MESVDPNKYIVFKREEFNGLLGIWMSRMPVVVGAGGAAGQGSGSGSAASGVGGTSSWNGISATGGTAVTIAARQGGSNADFAGGTDSTGVGAGGGAGAGAVGVGSVPGTGVEWPTGSGQRYGGGGGGVTGGSNAPQAGAAGGGGAASTSAGGTAGTDGRGGGGGGGTSTGGGGKGGNGVVILRYPFTLSYAATLIAQGYTDYWSLQAALADSDTELNLIGTRNMVMTSGAVPVGSSGPLTASDGNGCVTFAAADTEYLTATGLSWDPKQNWSWSGWYRSPSALSGNSTILYQFDITSGNTYIFLLHRDDQGGMVLQIGTGGSACYLKPTVNFQVGDNLWHHIVITRSYSATNASDVWTMYIDNVQRVQSTAATMGFTANGTAVSNQWVIAGREDAVAGSFFNGDVAHVGLATGVTLTPAQVAAQYALRAA